MILFTILFIMMLILAIFVVLATAIGGAAFIIVFADVIVCIWIIWLIIKRKRNKNY